MKNPNDRRMPSNVDVEGLKRENEQLRQELEKLRKGGNNKKGNS
jgi:hypothetical protein